MELNLSLQLLTLILAFGLGFAVGILYDLLRPPRYGKEAKYSPVPDLLFGLAAGSVIFAFAMKFGNGILGIWELSASLAGFTVYINSLSRLLLPVIMKICGKAAVIFEKNKDFIKKNRIFRKNLFKKT